MQLSEMRGCEAKTVVPTICRNTRISATRCRGRPGSPSKRDPSGRKNDSRAESYRKLE